MGKSDAHKYKEDTKVDIINMQDLDMWMYKVIAMFGAGIEYGSPHGIYGSINPF